jgi:hypothetical protein
VETRPLIPAGMAPGGLHRVFRVGLGIHDGWLLVFLEAASSP